jgi:hypothetical protein
MGEERTPSPARVLCECASDQRAKDEAQLCNYTTR